jgi:hypothetical protein
MGSLPQLCHPMTMRGGRSRPRGVAASREMATPSSKPPAPPPPCRIAFRLRTLLLVPLVIGAILGPLRLSAGRLDGLLPLYVMSGAAFGSVWAIAWMRMVGTRKHGLKRVLALTWTATCAGFTSGILIGPINLLVAIARRELPTPTIEGEIVSAILDGSWLGGVLGAAGGAMAGPLRICGHKCLCTKVFRDLVPVADLRRPGAPPGAALGASRPGFF